MQKKEPILLVGLGNPGSEYQNTRHNAGFVAIDKIATKYNITNYSSKFNAEFTTINTNNYTIYILKPQTFMNLSGKSVQQAMAFYKIKPENIIVMHDDLDITLGKIKTKYGGSNAGHNGLGSIDLAIGQGYWRIRIGISRPMHQDIAVYVLQNFTQDEQNIINNVTEVISENIANITTKQFDLVTKAINHTLQL